MGVVMEKAAHRGLISQGTQQAGLSSWLAKISIPSYYKDEDMFNAVSHLFGAALAFSALVWSLVTLVMTGASPNEVAGILIYCTTLIILYSASGAYHLVPAGNAKRVLRVMDHCTIYLLIAGCYTPVALIAFWGYSFAPIILAVEWGIAFFGIIVNIVDMNSLPVKIFSMISYLIMGWMVVLVPFDLLLDVGQAWFGWILAGGLAYTVGMIFYGLGSKMHYMHCVWHVFVLAGSILQFVGFIQMI